jgi:hypothetical protein
MRFTDDRGVGFSLSPMTRAAMGYFGPPPRIDYSDVAWFTTYPGMNVVELATLLRLHWTVFLNRGVVVNVMDPRSHALEDGGRAFTSLWRNRPTLVVKASRPTPWSILIVSSRKAEDVQATLEQRAVRAERRDPRTFRDFLR